MGGKAMMDSLMNIEKDVGSKEMPPSSPPIPAQENKTKAPAKTSGSAFDRVFGDPEQLMRLGTAQLRPQSANPVGDLSEPPTAENVLFTGGTMMAPLAKMVPFLGRLPLPILRVILGAAGAELGAELEGKPAGQGAVVGGTAATIGEGIGGGLSLGGWAMSKTKWGKANAKAIVEGAKAEAERLAAGRAAAKEAAGVAAESAAAGQQQQRAATMAQQTGGVMGKASPPMQVGSATQMEDVARRPVEQRAKLGKYFDSKLAETEGLIGADTKIRVPSLVDKQALREELTAQLGKQGAPAKVIDQMVEQEAASQSMMTVRDASDKIARLGLRGFSETAEKRGAFSVRETRRAALDEVRQELGARSPDALAAWDEGRRGFQVGVALLATLKREGIFDKTPEGTTLTIRELQGAISRNRERLQRAMLPEDWNALRHIVFEGGDLAKMDLPQKTIIKQAGEAARSRFETGTPPAKTFESILAERQNTNSPFSGRELLQIVIDSGIERALNRGAAPTKPVR